MTKLSSDGIEVKLPYGGKAIRYGNWVQWVSINGRVNASTWDALDGRIKKLFCDKIIDLPPYDRRLVYLGDHYNGGTQVVKYADYNDLPVGFEFKEMRKNELYVMHPLNDKVYVPFEGSDVEFLKERVRDFMFFLAACGARKVRAYASIRHYNGEWNSSRESIDASASIFANGSFSYNSSSSSAEQLATSSTLNFEREFEGKTDFQLINRLKWYGHEDSWQKIREEREFFGTKSLKETISSSTTRVISSSNKEAIKADLKVLMFKGAFSKESEVSRLVETYDDIVETVEVEF